MTTLHDKIRKQLTAVETARAVDRMYWYPKADYTAGKTKLKLPDTLVTADEIAVARAYVAGEADIAMKLRENLNFTKVPQTKTLNGAVFMLVEGNHSNKKKNFAIVVPNPGKKPVAKAIDFVLQMASPKEAMEGASVVETAKKHKSHTKMVKKISAIVQAMGMEAGEWEVVSNAVFKNTFGKK